jgi:hypothetical protein
MKTKLISCLFWLMMLFAFSPAAMADSLQDGDQVYVLKGIGSVGVGYTIADLSLKPLFPTFCLELNEYLDGQPLTVHIDTYAIAGGLGGVNPGDPGDYISIPTAFLYFSFRNGTIPDFDVTSYDDVSALEFAFWILEDEKKLADVNPLLYSWYPKLIEYLDFAQSSDWTDIDGVAVLNLSHTNVDGVVIQNQSFLTLVPEPMTLLLLGLGLLGLGITGRKLKK